MVLYLDNFCYYFGKKTIINVVLDSTVKSVVINFTEDIILIKTNQINNSTINQALISFFKKKLKQYIEKKIKSYQPNFKSKPKNVKIEDSIKHWGTCNHLRELRFNAKLILLPTHIIDYVVVHEMCHMVHLNHDRSFWRLLGKIYPDYKTCETWLNDRTF